MKCSKCGLENRDEAKYCRRCGVELMSKNSVIQEDNIIGRDEIIQKLKGVINTLLTDKRREDAGYEPEMENKLFLFTGESGTGKSTIANWFINELKNENLLNGNPCVFDAKQLKQKFGDEFMLSNFLHQSTSKLLIIENIHIDMDYAGEIFRAVSSNQLGKIVICIGLNQPIEKFLNDNPDIKQKIYDTPFTFTNYSTSDLKNILEKKINEKEYSFSEDVDDLLFEFVSECNDNPDKKHDNGWLIEREAWPKIYETFSTRIKKSPSSNLQLLLPEDISLKNRKRTEEEIFAELDSLIGLDNIKTQVRQLMLSVKTTIELRKNGTSVAKLPAIHIVFKGNPGTGKNTVARILGELFNSIGLMPGSKVVEVDRSKIVAEYVGQTAPLVNKWCDKAMGGILFIDEAYSLKQSDNDSFGQEAIDTLLKRMEDDRGKFIVIVAGYTDEMNSFLQSNPGLASRFNTDFEFRDYVPDDLLKIYQRFAAKENFTLTDAALVKASVGIKKLYAARTKSFGNGREMRTLWERTYKDFSVRYQNLPPEKKTEEAANTIEAEDIKEGA